MSICEVLTEAKLNNKSSVFFVHYLKKNNEIHTYKISFLNYNDKKIHEDMKRIEDSNDFERWLSIKEIKHNRL